MTPFRPPHRPADPAPAPALSDREAVRAICRAFGFYAHTEAEAVVRAVLADARADALRPVLALADQWLRDGSAPQHAIELRRAATPTEETR